MVEEVTFGRGRDLVVGSTQPSGGSIWPAHSKQSCLLHYSESSWHGNY